MIVNSITQTNNMLIKYFKVSNYPKRLKHIHGLSLWYANTTKLVPFWFKKQSLISAIWKFNIWNVYVFFQVKECVDERPGAKHMETFEKR